MININILVIGNGFDLAHGLPTTYKDFLNYITFLCKMEKSIETPIKFKRLYSDEFNQLNTDVQNHINQIIINDLEMTVEDICKTNQNISEMIRLAKNNIWISWFQDSDTLKEGWIDFELEISNIVQEIELIQNASKNQIKKSTTDKGIKFLDKLKSNLYRKEIIEIDYSQKYNFKIIKEEMLFDLNNLIYCLELYLEDCIKNIDKLLLSPDIYDLKIDKVLSFNYTDTYERLYSCKNTFIEYDYIHGKSKTNLETANNMVLGIDEYLSDEERNYNTRFIEFKKYYQRIHKLTGCVFRTWLDKIDNNSREEENHLYIFGHSLDITDKDIFEKLIKSDKIKTTIFYKDAERYGQLISNLVKILGQDDLISMVYGQNQKIKFKMQRDMINKSNSEWQILNDIYSLWNLYDISTVQAESLIKRIEFNIENSIMHYFDNQRKVISLYDALDSNMGINDILSEKLFDIACNLINKNDMLIFDPHDWENIDFSGVYPCSQKTSSFIIKLNNFTRENTYKNITDFEANQIDNLYNQIKKSKIDNETFVYLFDLLFLKFGDDNIQPKQIWNCIYELNRKVDSDYLCAFIKDKCMEERGDRIKMCRLKHIQEVIDENEYLQQMEEQQYEYEKSLAY